MHITIISSLGLVRRAPLLGHRRMDFDTGVHSLGAKFRCPLTGGVILEKPSSVRNHSNLDASSQHTASDSRGCCNKWPQIGWLKTTKVYSLAALEVRVQDQGVGSAALSLEVPEEDLPRTLSLAHGCVMPVPASMVTPPPLLSLCNFPLPRSHEDICHWIIQGDLISWS